MTARRRAAMAVLMLVALATLSSWSLLAAAQTGDESPPRAPDEETLDQEKLTL